MMKMTKISLSRIQSGHQEQSGPAFGLDVEDLLTNIVRKIATTTSCPALQSEILQNARSRSEKLQEFDEENGLQLGRLQ